MLKKLCFPLLLAMLLMATAVGCGQADTTEGSEAAEATDSLGAFSVSTLDGGTFTNENLADYELTMIDVWATWCGVCLDTMPYWSELETQLPDGVQIVSVCMDGETDLETAKQIVADNGLTMPVLIAQGELSDWLENKLNGVPTTLFVNSNGEVIGNIISGAPASDQVEFYLTQIETRLEP